MKYQAILFAPDGAFITDFQRNTIKEVWDCISDMGSRWIFYPICFVGTDKTIVGTPDIDHLKGKRIKTVQKYIANEYQERPTEIIDALNEGIPLEMIY